ncbi:MAG TPA: hypothetical protein VG389_22235 [Myxococcota bacterium]|jgi:hypothetical protein|nr:hypothetical protein [Myxococcota bacterium]
MTPRREGALLLAIGATALAGCGAGGRADAGATSADGAATSDTGAASDAAGGTDATAALVDLDGDGLDDAVEQMLAESYLPFMSLSPMDGCPTMGIVFRLTPHALDATKVHVIYDVLYDEDCGAGGHVGDDEVFAATIDPAVPAPAGILALRAISHQGTPCEAVTDCGCAAGGLTACETQSWMGASWPVVYASRDKHGSYVFEGTCDGACFFTNYCDLAPTPAVPLLVNAGEPGAPLTNDLTAAGLVTTANGWMNAALFDYDPWGAVDFGGAGSVAGDLVDPAFDTPVPGC